MTKQTNNATSFHPALQFSSIGIWERDLSSNTIIYSPEWKRIRGYENDWECPAPQGELAMIHPDDRANVNAHREQLISGAAENYSLVYRTRHANGTDIWVEDRARAICDNSGTVVQLVGCEIDVTNLLQDGRIARERTQDSQSRIVHQTKSNLASELTKTKQTPCESERRFSSLAAAFPFAVVRFDQSGKNCTYVNDRWCELTGCRSEAALGNGYQKFIHPDDLDKLAEYNQRLAKDPSRIAGALIKARHTLSDGSLEYLQCQLSKEFDQDGNISGFVATVAKVLENNQSEEEMQQLNQRFLNVLECSLIGIWEWSIEKEELVWDERMFDIYGVEKADFRGSFEDWTDRLHPDDFARATTEDTDRTEKIGSSGSEFRIVRPNGDVRDIYCWVYHEKDDDGNPIRAVGLNLDITNRRQAERALLESENKFRRVAEGVPGVISRFIVRADGSHATNYVSSQCRELFEVEPEDALSQADLLLNRIHPDDVALVKETVQNSVKNLQPLKIEFRVLLPTKGLRWLQSVAMPSKLKDGTTAFDEFILDITDRKEIELANDALAKATKTKDEFIANMSHELRTPLSAILAMTEGLQQGIFGQTTPRQLASLRVVEESGLHLLGLINEVLDLAKIESGQFELTLSQVDIPKLCTTSLSLVAQQAENKKIELNLNLPNYLPKFVGDEKILLQILINLLSNAVKFTPESGQVKLDVVKRTWADEKLRDILQISITDNGIGVESDKLGSLFDPFVQVDSSFSRSYEGTGLGLSLVKQFVELHHGSIRVESEIGIGSSFTIELPYILVCPNKLADKTDKQPPPVHQNVAPVEMAKNKATILLVEDNNSVASAITAILESAGYQVSRAVNGKEAVDYTFAQNPNLILMDIQMPVTDGLEATRQIRANTEFAQTPIIALSGFAMPEDSSRCIKAGANEFISKPCRMPQLLALISDLLKSKLVLPDSN